MRFISLKTKFVLLCVFLSTATTGLLGSYLVWKSYQSLRHQAQQAQMALAKTLASQINQGVGRAFQAVEVLSKRSEITDMIKQPMLRELSLVTSATELLDALLVVSPEGDIFARSHPDMDFRNFPSAGWFKKTIPKVEKLKKMLLVEIYPAQNDTLDVAIAAPILNPEDGSNLGMLVGLLYLPNHTIGNLEEVHFGTSGYAYLVNEDGMAVIHPNKSKLLEDLSQNPAVKALRQRKDGFIQFQNQDGQEILAAFSRVESADWGVVVRQPAAECYEPAISMLKVMSLFLFITLVISAALSAILAKRVVRPILALVQKVEKIETGKMNEDDREKYSPKDEVGLLNHAVDRMAKRLETQEREREFAFQRALSAEKKLSESERLASIGQLTAGLAHELNNPLGIIFGTAQLALGSKGRQLRKWIERIRLEADRCRKLVSELLDFAKPMKLSSRKTDLVKLAENTWGQLNADDGKDLYKLAVIPRTFQAKVDPDRFKQVFINLMTNAVHAMPKGGKLKVKFWKTDDTAHAVVEDEGTDFNKKDAEVIFRPFYTSKSRGTGLGLSITRAILQAHGGRIWAEATKKRGAKFVMEWPNPSRKRTKNGA
jgi:signal transduction histidine kinase